MHFTKTAGTQMYKKFGKQTATKIKLNHTSDADQGWSLCPILEGLLESGV